MNIFETPAGRWADAPSGAAPGVGAAGSSSSLPPRGGLEPQTPAEPCLPGGSAGQTEVSPEAARSGLTSQTSGPAVSAGEAGPAGPGTTWTVELPPLELVTSNQRLHYMAKARLMKAIRDSALWLARAQNIPNLQRARIVGELRFPDRRRRDPANWADSAKAATDGLVSAGVLPDDDATHLLGPDMRLGEPDRALASRGLAGHARLNLHITELPEETS